MKNSLVSIILAATLQTAAALEPPVISIDTFIEGDSVSVTLSWPEVNGAGSYSVYSMTIPDSPGELLAEVTIGQFSHISAGNRFYYVVANALVAVPSEPAPAPVHPEAVVISLFSDVYADITVDYWSTDWDQAEVEEVQIAGDAAKLYSNLELACIEFISELIDGREMTHLHLDIWTPDPTAAPAVFNLTLADLGTDCYWSGDDFSHQLTFDDGSSPPLQTESWVSFDLPLSGFAGVLTRNHLARLLLSGNLSTLYLDNLYFYNAPPQTEPWQPAPLPEYSAEDVIALFSNQYGEVPVDSWSTSWDQADVADFQVNGDDIKLYTNLVFAGIEFASQTIDASEMTHFRLDFWTADPTELPADFRIKLVDFGADGIYGGGDDREHELEFDRLSDPELHSGSWISFDIPLSEFTTLTSREHLAQLLISGDPNTVYIDNVLFHR